MRRFPYPSWIAVRSVTSWCSFGHELLFVPSWVAVRSVMSCCSLRHELLFVRSWGAVHSVMSCCSLRHDVLLITSWVAVCSVMRCCSSYISIFIVIRHTWIYVLLSDTNHEYCGRNVESLVRHCRYWHCPAVPHLYATLNS